MTIITVDYYSGNAIPPYEKFRDRYGIQLYFRKFSMGGGPDNNLEKDVPLLRNAGGILGGTHWVDPIQSAANQSEYFLYQINKWKPSVLLYDIEQWWSIWGRQNAGKNADGTWIDPHLSPEKILNSVATIVGYVSSRVGLPYLLYTSSWFVTEYCKQLGTWIGTQPTMLAGYPDYFFLWPKQEKPVRRPYRPQDYDLMTPRPSDLVDYMSRMDVKQLAIPPGVKNVRIWQITSRVLTPESPTDPYDFSRWLGTDAEFRSFLGLDPAPVPAFPAWKDVDKDGIARKLAESHGYGPFS